MEDRQLTINVKIKPVTGGFIGYIPDAPGVTGFGVTEEELMYDLRNGLKAMLLENRLSKLHNCKVVSVFGDWILVDRKI